MTTSRDRHEDPTNTAGERDARVLDQMLAGPPEQRGGDVHRTPPAQRSSRAQARRSQLGMTDAELVRELAYGVS